MAELCSMLRCGEFVSRAKHKLDIEFPIFVLCFPLNSFLSKKIMPKMLICSYSGGSGFKHHASPWDKVETVKRFITLDHLLPRRSFQTMVIDHDNGWLWYINITTYMDMSWSWPTTYHPWSWFTSSSKLILIATNHLQHIYVLTASWLQNGMHHPILTRLILSRNAKLRTQSNPECVWPTSTEKSTPPKPRHTAAKGGSKCMTSAKRIPYFEAKVARVLPGSTRQAFI